MTTQWALLLSAISLAFALYQGISNLRRNKTADDKNEAAQLTTVIVKLEQIGTGITEIKGELSNVKIDIKEDREKIIAMSEQNKALKESILLAHKRLDACEKNCKRVGVDASE